MSVPEKSANNPLPELDAVAGGADELSALREQLASAKDNIAFLQETHTSTLRGLHEEIERLHNISRDLQFRCEAECYLLPDGDFFKCGAKALEQKVNDLVNENAELRRKLSDSHQAIDILDQKEKLALWQHHQELEQRDETLLRLQTDLEDKCSVIAQLTASSQGARRKKNNFWRRFSFTSPSTSSNPVPPPHSKVQPPRVEHLSREDLPTEMQGSFNPGESQYQSYSSYSSLSDKSVSDDEGLGHSRPAEKSKLSVRLPPIAPLVSNRQLVRQQLRVHGASDTLAIDQIPACDIPLKRTNKT